MAKRAGFAKRLAVVPVVTVTVLAGAAAVAPARVTNAGNTISLGFAPYGEAPGGRFGGSIDSKANYHCEQNRKVELLHDGTKVGSAETEKYPGFTISLVSIPAGTYVAKVKRQKLPASLQAKPGKNHAIYCKAAQSNPVVLP
ncbi:MAG: hypothetical protein ACOYD4_05530 [Solirubrobacterales bacterium]